VNGVRAKPAREVGIGDWLHVTRGEQRVTLVVAGLAERRWPAPAAAALYEETPESAAARERLASERRLVSEVVGNTGARHASGPAWVNLDWSRERPVLTVHDLGPGFTPQVDLPADPDSTDGRGLYLVARLTAELEIASKRAGGARVTATLAVRRAPEESFDPPRRAVSALPTPEEAESDGTFGKEPFLRALVVQLAQHVERELGPVAAAAAVAQVGADVGARMEEEYRRVRSIVERLTPEQLADLDVRLKRAIQGDFYVIEGARRPALPFGDVVRRAPTLCRMTSSVFGGIGARNAGGASVQLEERIAVGDLACRVVVWLGEETGSRLGYLRRAAGEVATRATRDRAARRSPPPAARRSAGSG